MRTLVPSPIKAFTLGLLALSFFTVGARADSAGGLEWTAPAGWENQRRPMRAANYLIPGASGGESGELAVYYFGPGQGGSVEMNVKRWIGQFRAPDGGPADALAKRTDEKVGDISVTLIDLRGTYLFKPFPMAPKAQEKPGYRMLAAIAQGADAPVFFKLTAPEKTAAAAEAKFQAVIDSLRKSP